MSLLLIESRYFFLLSRDKNNWRAGTPLEKAPQKRWSGGRSRTTFTRRPINFSSVEMNLSGRKDGPVSRPFMAGGRPRHRGTEGTDCKLGQIDRKSAKLDESHSHTIRPGKGRRRRRATCPAPGLCTPLQGLERRRERKVMLGRPSLYWPSSRM